MLKTQIYFDQRFKGVSDSYKYTPITTLVKKLPNYSKLDNFLSKQVLNLDLGELENLSNYIIKNTSERTWIPISTKNESELISKINGFLKEKEHMKNLENSLPIKLRVVNHNSK